MGTDTISHRNHWDKKYAQGNTHASYIPDLDLANLIHHFPTSGLTLDVACGTGRNSFFIAEHGLDVVCLDFSAQGLNFLKHHRCSEPITKKLFPIQADLSNTPLPDESFDAVFVIRYLDRTAFRSYVKMLKPKGLLFFKAFNTNHLNSKPNFNPNYLLNKQELISTFADNEIIATNDSQNNEDEESMILVRKQPAKSLMKND